MYFDETDRDKIPIAKRAGYAAEAYQKATVHKFGHVTMISQEALQGIMGVVLIILGSDLTCPINTMQMQTPIVKKPSPMVPLVKNHHSSKKPYNSYHWCNPTQPSLKQTDIF